MKPSEMLAVNQPNRHGHHLVSGAFATVFWQPARTMAYLSSSWQPLSANPKYWFTPLATGFLLHFLKAQGDGHPRCPRQSIL